MRVPRGSGPAARWTRMVLVGVMAVTAFVPLMTRASAAGTFTFFGSGYGHGAGLSQYGAKGLADRGYPHRKILRHYYRGTRVDTTSAAPRLRIGLVQDQSVIHLTAAAAAVRLRVGSQGAADLASIPSGETWSVVVVAGKYVVRDAEGVPVGEPVGRPDEHLFAVYVPTGARVHVVQAGRTLNRGYIELNIDAADRLRAVAAVPLEAYLYGLGEVPSSWPMAALRAQAVAARTYALEKVARSGQHRADCNCALFASVRDQHYSGYDKEAGVMGARWVQAVDETRGQVIRYEGELIQAFYHSSSGGITESSEHVFIEELPYIRSTCDPGDYTEDNPNRVWKVGPLGAAEVTAALAGATGDIGTVVRFRKQVREPSDRLAQVTVVGETGEAVISGDQLRLSLGLKSTRVFIDRNLNVEGKIRQRYDRHGCRPGSATTPSRAMPQGRFQRFESGAIYRNGADDVTVWLRGTSYDKYVRMGEWESRLGMPAGATRRLKARCRSSSCSATRFERGRIFTKSRAGVGPHALRGPVLQHYLQIGGPRSLGYPVADTLKLRGPVLGRFERGTIHCDEMGICRT